MHLFLILFLSTSSDVVCFHMLGCVVSLEATLTLLDAEAIQLAQCVWSLCSAAISQGSQPQLTLGLMQQGCPTNQYLQYCTVLCVTASAMLCCKEWPTRPLCVLSPVCLKCGEVRYPVLGSV